MASVNRVRVAVRWTTSQRFHRPQCGVWVGGISSLEPRIRLPPFPRSPTLSVIWLSNLPDGSDESTRERKDKQTEEESEADANSGKELMKNWLKQLRSPPNVITSARIASAPLLSYLIITEQHEYALYGCLLAGFSDWLDGYLAKRFNMATVLGTYLDPMADKVMINVLSLSLWYSDILPTPLVVLWLGRDVLLVFGAYWHVRTATFKGELPKGRWVIDPVKTPLKVEPTNISKANTVLQFFTLSLGLLQPLGGVPPGVLDMSCVVTGATTIASGFSYLGNSAFTKSGNKKKRDVVGKRIYVPDPKTKGTDKL